MAKSIKINNGLANTTINPFCSLDTGHHPLSGRTALFVFILALGLAIFHLYSAIIPSVSELQRNTIHFAGFSLICVFIYPHFFVKKKTYSKSILISNWILGLLIAFSSLYIAYAEDSIYQRGVSLSSFDWLAGTIVCLGAIELTRRATGWIIPCLIIFSLSYVTWLGPLVPGVFSFKGLTTETVLFRSLYGDDALFGSIARISSTYIFLFILFGAFLLRSGAGDFVVDLSKAIAGKMTGGQGFVAVIASGLTGTISGSAIANTASTGVITIPLMKRAGFPATFAAAVESSASTGGQLMPPIMGAGAFVMASYTQIAYEHIVAVAALPALLYFASIAFFVRIEAKKHHLKADTNKPISVWLAIKTSGASFILPICLLIGLLVYGLTPSYAAVISIFAVILSSYLTQHPMGIKAILEALVLGTKNMVMTAILLCSVGLIINVVATTGIGNTFSLMIVDWANGQLFIAIFLIGVASLILGMGLPVTAAYIVLATLSAPALANLITDMELIKLMTSGILPEDVKPLFLLSHPDAMHLLSSPLTEQAAKNLLTEVPIDLISTIREQAIPQSVLTSAILAAHMIIFWLSQDSNVTPPVCLAAFTAAAIAKTPPMKTGFYSWKIAKGLYIIPLLFAYTPLLSDDWSAAITTFAFALCGIYAVIAAIEGFLEAKLNYFYRVTSFISGILCLYPDLTLNLLGLVVFIGLFWRNKRSNEGLTKRG